MTRSTIATRDRIHRAAFTLFCRYGFKRTSMEDIAAEAGLSRAALYLQFRNKEDLFRDLARELNAESIALAEAALTEQRPLADRLRAVVEARMLRMIEIAYDSPHGSELMDEKNRLCGDLWADSERAFQALMVRLFKRAAHAREINLAGAGLGAAEAADLFLRAVSGLKGPGVTADIYRNRLASLVRVFVAGMGGTHAARTASESRSKL
jgi:AcrR family transcriptional regulator